MINQIISNTIRLFHIIVILFVVIIPLTNGPYLLLFHTIFVPFLILHWVTNNNTCVLTTTEKFFRDVKTKDDEKECLTCQLISPMFDFKKNYEKFSKLIYTATIALWIISLLKLITKFHSGEIQTLRQLFTVTPIF
jgi:hypothetical protein